MTYSKPDAIKALLHKQVFDLAMASMKAAFPGKKEEHLMPCARSIAIKLAGTFDESELSKAHAYGSRLLKSIAPQFEPLPTMTGVIDQLDNYICKLKKEITSTPPSVKAARQEALPEDRA